MFACCFVKKFQATIGKIYGLTFCSKQTDLNVWKT